MEDTLGGNMETRAIVILYGLNPCSNRRYSRSGWLSLPKRHRHYVLILVLMEDTLGVHLNLIMTRQ